MKVRRTVSYGDYNNITVEVDSEDAGYLPGAMTCDETFKVLTELVDRNIRRAIRKHELDEKIQLLEKNLLNGDGEPKQFVDDFDPEPEAEFEERHKRWAIRQAWAAKELVEAKAQLAKWSEEQ